MENWQRLVEMLLETAGDLVDEQGCPTWVRVLDPPSGCREEQFSLACSQEPDGHLGWVATADCQAVGVIATGRLRPVPGTSSGPFEPEPDQLRMACLVTRSGETAWKLLLPGGVPAEDPPSEGRLLDCLRRCFGLPTPPPPVGPGHLQAVAWLAAILERIQSARRPLSWSEVSQLHPVARVLCGELPPEGPELLPRLMRLAGSAWTWEDFRLRAQRDRCLAGIIEPDLAGWMDDGMFARWVLSGLPSPDEMMIAVRHWLSPSATRRLAHAVHDLVHSAGQRFEGAAVVGVEAGGEEADRVQPGGAVFVEPGPGGAPVLEGQRRAGGDVVRVGETLSHEVAVIAGQGVEAGPILAQGRFSPKTQIQGEAR